MNLFRQPTSSKTQDAGSEKIDAELARGVGAVASAARCYQSINNKEKRAARTSPGRLGNGVALGTFLTMELCRVCLSALASKRSTVSVISRTRGW